MIRKGFRFGKALKGVATTEQINFREQCRPRSDCSITQTAFKDQVMHRQARYLYGRFRDATINIKHREEEKTPQNRNNIITSNRFLIFDRGMLVRLLLGTVVAGHTLIAAGHISCSYSKDASSKIISLCPNRSNYSATAYI